MKKIELLLPLIFLVNISFSQPNKGISEDTTTMENISCFQKVPPPPPPPPPPKKKEVNDNEGFISFKQTVPLFPACQEVENQSEKKKCADDAMLDFIYKNLVYPEAAKRDSIEGMVVIRFVVEKNGKLTSQEIVRDKLGYGCGEAALEVVKKMPDWIPGTQRDRPVRVQFNLPVKFKL